MNPQEEMTSPLCHGLEADLNAFVDGELDVLDSGKVMEHLEGCARCREYVESLRRFAAFHRTSFDPETLAGSLDHKALFREITGELLQEKVERVAELFYQLGKAYLTRGFARRGRVGRGPGTRRVRHDMISPPRPIDRTRMKANRIFREAGDLASAGGHSGKAIKRARGFFRAVRTRGGDDLEIGRRFMEESLAIDPDRPEPRIFLGCYYYVGARKYEAAREQFRKVLLLPGLSEEQRAQALIDLGLTYNIEYRYEEALACFREVVKGGIIQRHPRFYRCMLFLAVTHAKLGEYEESVEGFHRTVREFPSHVDEIRKDLYGMQSFQQVVSTVPRFRAALEHRVPVLFAG